MLLSLLSNFELEDGSNILIITPPAVHQNTQSMIYLSTSAINQGSWKSNKHYQEKKTLEL